ncbi:MAG: ribonuclease H-like domain-containing protein [Patescibacteria group bacterium]
MKKFPVVLDLETKHTFRDFKEHKDLGISVVAIYDYKSSQARTFLEGELNELFPILESCSYIIGYNINSFDIPVLAPYYAGNVTHFSSFDLLEDIRAKLGRRLALNDLISATLNIKKSGHGLMAIDLYKEGKFEELASYCADDVKVTKELFEYGIRTGEIFYLDETGKQSIKVNWKKYLEEDSGNDMPLTLPF